jgi:hypothetical protein
MDPLTAPTRDLLEWIAERPRTYAETIEVWRSHCPRLSVWEDAVVAGYVRVDRSRVRLTPEGETALEAASRPS